MTFGTNFGNNANICITSNWHVYHDSLNDKRQLHKPLSTIIVVWRKIDSPRQFWTSVYNEQYSLDVRYHVLNFQEGSQKLCKSNEGTQYAQWGDVGINMEPAKDIRCAVCARNLHIHRGLKYYPGELNFSLLLPILIYSSAVSSWSSAIIHLFVESSWEKVI